MKKELNLKKAKANIVIIVKSKSVNVYSQNLTELEKIELLNAIMIQMVRKELNKPPADCDE